MFAAGCSLCSRAVGKSVEIAVNYETDCSWLNSQGSISGSSVNGAEGEGKVEAQGSERRVSRDGGHYTFDHFDQEGAAQITLALCCPVRDSQYGTTLGVFSVSVVRSQRYGTAGLVEPSRFAAPAIGSARPQWLPARSAALRPPCSLQDLQLVHHCLYVT